MITCPNCAKENQDHYKFCLACGSKLPAPPPGAPAPVPQMGTPAPIPAPAGPSPSTGTPTPIGTAPTQDQLPIQGSEHAPPAFVPAVGSNPLATAGADALACSQCGFVNPGGFVFCGRCGQRLGEPPPAPTGDGPSSTVFVPDASEAMRELAARARGAQSETGPGPASDPTTPSPGGPVPAGSSATDRATSESESPQTPSPPAMPPPETDDESPPEAAPDPATGAPAGLAATGAAPAGSAKLIMLGPDGQPIGERVLAMGETLVVGRGSGPPWEDDAYLDPKHASLTPSDGGIEVEDHASLNGIYVKLTDKVEVVSGDQFRVGQELILYEDLPEPQPTDDGTERMGSPNPGYWGRVSVLVDPDHPSAAYPIDGDGITIGRENGDIVFPQDGYVSGKHCRIVGDDDGVYIEDVGSSNGTYMRVRGGQVVPYGSLVLIGQKLFQLERS